MTENTNQEETDLQLLFNEKIPDVRTIRTLRRSFESDVKRFNKLLRDATIGILDAEVRERRQIQADLSLSPRHSTPVR